MGTFTVVAVDADRRTVDLEAIDTHKIEKSIAFDVSSPLEGTSASDFAKQIGE